MPGGLFAALLLRHSVSLLMPIADQRSSAKLVGLGMQPASAWHDLENARCICVL